MELKPALDRILEALSPALSAELDRVAGETSDGLEQDFQKRLEAAVFDTEAATAKAAQAELSRAVEEAREATGMRVTEELELKFKETLEMSANQLKAEFATERERLQEQLHQWRVFAETQRQLGEASSQAEILARFLRLADAFAAGLAVYIAKADGLALWKHRGVGAFPEIISEETTDPEFYFRTITIRGKAVAAVCAAPPFKAEALDFLGSSMERAIEIFGLKLRSPAPKTVVASETTVAVPTGAQPTASPSLHDEQKVHAEARRTARLLISELKLYHEDELRAGRQHSDIYHRLRKEIDQSRETYTHRVPKDVLVGHDYFHEELVRILGENDPSRLGATYPGPMSQP